MVAGVAEQRLLDLEFDLTTAGGYITDPSGFLLGPLAGDMQYTTTRDAIS